MNKRFIFGLVTLILLSGCGSEWGKQYDQPPGWYKDGTFSDVYLGSTLNLRLYLTNEGVPECENEVVLQQVHQTAYDPVSRKEYDKIIEVNATVDKLCKGWYGCPHCYRFIDPNIVYYQDGAIIAESFHRVGNVT